MPAVIIKKETFISVSVSPNRETSASPLYRLVAQKTAHQKICNIMNEYPGFIFNLGHGITPDINPDKVKVMINALRA